MPQEPAQSPEPFQPRPAIFYGWYMVAATFAIMAISCGLGYYNLTVFLKAFVSYNGFSVETVSLATAIFSISNGFTGLFVAWSMDRFDPRWTISAGAIVLTLSLIGAGHVSTHGQLFLFYVVFGMGYAATSLVPCTTLVARWFSRRRAQALAIASTGLSFGGILFTPLAASLIDKIGFVLATFSLSFFAILIIPIALMVLRPTPASMGLTPDGEALERSADGNPLPPQGLMLGEALRTRYFYLFTLLFTLIFISQIGGLAHQFRLVAERTASDHIGGTAVAIMAAFSILGRLVGGFILSRITTRQYILALLVIQGFSYSLFAETYSATGLMICSALLGATVGNMQVMMPLMVAESFGVKAYARIFSMVQMVSTCLQAVGPILIGVLYTRVGGYEIAYHALLVFTLISIGIVLRMGPSPMTLRSAAS